MPSGYSFLQVGQLGHMLRDAKACQAYLSEGMSVCSKLADSLNPQLEVFDVRDAYD
jgi:hypothetical protein